MAMTSNPAAPSGSNVLEIAVSQKLERRLFNRWYQRYADTDGKFTHIPRWLKQDLWEAWLAGRLALRQQESRT